MSTDCTGEEKSLGGCTVGFYGRIRYYVDLRIRRIDMNNGSIVVANPANAAARPDAAARRAAKQARRAEAARLARLQAVRTPKGAGPGAAVTRKSTNSNEPVTRFHAVFGPRELAFRNWMRTIHNPTGAVSGVPATVGSFQLNTDLWQDGLSGQAKADANGNFWIAVVVDSWIESGNATGTPLPTCQVMGYANPGYMVLATDGTAATAGIPLAGAIIPAGATATVLNNPAPNIINQETRARQVASRLRVWHAQSANDASGEMTIISSVNPGGSVQGGRLNGCSYSDLISTNPQVVSRYTVTLPNWKPDETIESVAIPAEENAFETYIWPANGYVAATPIFTMACMGKGLKPGAAVEWRVDVVFESEAGKTKRAMVEMTGESSWPPAKVQVDTPTLLMGASNSTKYATRPASVGESIHALPFVETLAVTNPAAVAAIDNHPSMLPVHTAARTRPAALSVYRPASGGVLDAIKTVGNGLVKSGALGMIPYVGPVVQGIASTLMRIFGN